MRIVCISDTHGAYPGLPAGDLLVHCGDLTRKGSLLELKRGAEWLQSTDFSRIILVPGNHDLICEGNLPLARRTLGSRIEVLIDSGTLVNGLMVWGSPWQPWFHDWAFNLRSEAELAMAWAKIPLNCNLLLTHCPPQGILDAVDSIPKGSASLRAREAELPALQAHVFGHIHRGHGTVELGGVRYINASICDEGYNACHSPVVIDLEVNS